MDKKIKALLVSNYKLDYSNYFPGKSMRFGDVEFVTDTTEDVDAVIICNHATHVINTKVSPQNVFHVHQEPGDKLYHGFMFNKVAGQKCGHLPLADINSHPCLNWLVNKTYDELTQMNTAYSCVKEDKTELFSGVISGHNALEGHYFRLKVLKEIEGRFEMDLFGKGHNFIPDKWDALYPYQFSLAMENSSQADYWTEKIMDCFLACTMPVYYGCSNIGKYFPKDSFIQLDVDNIQYSLDSLKEKLNAEFFYQNYDHILEARELCLDKYATAPGLSNIIETHYQQLPKKNTIIKPFKRSVLTDLKRKLARNRLAHWINDSDH